MAENPLSTISKMDPPFAEHLAATDRLVYGEGSLPKKYKLLIAMAFDAAHGAVAGVRSLATRALEAGATKEEVSEAIRVACHLGGVGSLYTASQAFTDLFS